MDLLTQIGNYLSYLTALMVSSIEEINSSAPPISPQAAESALSHEWIAKAEDKSEQIASRFRDLDLLLGSLPKSIPSEAEQLEEIQALEEENIRTIKELEEVQKEAEFYRQKVSSVIEKLAEEQLNYDSE